MNKLTMASLFDGSGGFPMAASMCGIEPVWASEVEPYPISVTRQRFQNMKHMGDVPSEENLTDEQFSFWMEVRRTFDRINGRPEKDYTPKQILAWYNKLHTDSAEYKMWGNGIALPCALYVMEGIADVEGDS